MIEWSSYFDDRWYTEIFKCSEYDDDGVKLEMIKSSDDGSQ